MGHLAVKPQEAGGVEAGGRKRRKVIVGQPVQGSGERGFRKFPLSLLPASGLRLAVDCEEQRKEGCIKQKEERTPAGRPLTSDSERQRSGGRGVLQINSSEGRSWLFSLALRADCRRRFHIKGNGNQPVAISHQVLDWRNRGRVYAESPDRAAEAQPGGDDWTLIT
ncbi:hypothetical protein AAY473_033512 [Plecturocebus cupreus]